MSGAYQDVEAAKILLYTMDHLPAKIVGQEGQEVQDTLCRINDTPLVLVLVNQQPKYHATIASLWWCLVPDLGWLHDISCAMPALHPKLSLDLGLLLSGVFWGH